MMFGITTEFYLHILIALIYLLVINKLDKKVKFNNNKHKIQYWLINLFIAFTPILNMIFTLFSISELMNERKTHL